MMSSYITAATRTPKSQDSALSASPQSSSPAPPMRQPTKILLPKKAMKWSIGVGPGEYDGPHTTTKLRKYWGGEKEDPITSTDFIWNKDFMPQLEKLVLDQPQVPDSLHSLPPIQESSSGFLSLNRVMSLDSLEVDLSALLTATPKRSLEQNHTALETIETPKRRWKLAPTKSEPEKWDKATKAATGGSDVMLRESRQPKRDTELLAAQSREQYYKLKNKLQLLTMGIGGIGFISAYVSYSPEIAASFGAGLLGSLAYIRMLGNSVDSMASTGSKKMIKAAVGQPRLLVPVVLVMIYNRWNEIVAPHYGLMNLELIPMLVGFFTYKIATFAQAIEDAVQPFMGKDSQM